MCLGEVIGDVLGRPVLENKRAKQKNGNGEQVVVKHGVKVLKVCEFDTFTHAENVGSRRKAVHKHPEISGIKCSNATSGILLGAIGHDSATDVSPGGDDRG